MTMAGNVLTASLVRFRVVIVNIACVLFIYCVGLIDKSPFGSWTKSAPMNPLVIPILPLHLWGKVRVKL